MCGCMCVCGWMCVYLYSVPKSDRTTVHKNLIVALGVAELLLMCSDWVSASEVRLNIWHICTCLLQKIPLLKIQQCNSSVRLKSNLTLPKFNSLNIYLKLTFSTIIPEIIFSRVIQLIVPSYIFQTVSGSQTSCQG